MINENEVDNPKALNLFALEGGTSKVTLGFKCTPQLKLRLALEAEQLGLTLSSYVENLIENAEEFIEDSEQLVKAKTKQVETLTNQIKQQGMLIEFYESPILKKIFSDFKNQQVSYVDSNGNKINLTLNSIADVYTVLVNSFQTSIK